MKGAASGDKEKKGQAAKRPGLLVKAIRRRTTGRLFRVGRGSGRGRFLMLRASPQAQRTGRNGHNHDCFENFHLIFRLLSLQVAAVI
jgi:hypothetical protein